MAIKSESPDDVVAAVLALEQRSDDWAKNNKLFDRAWNLAAWHGLTACARSLELEIPPALRGGSHHQNAVTNLSAAAYQMYRAAIKHGKPAAVSMHRMRWGLPEELISETVREAHSYAMFCADFPAWHRDMYSVVNLDENSVQFEIPSLAKEQRFRAYESGFRTYRERPPIENTWEEKEAPSLDAMWEKIALSMSAVGKYGFRHDSLGELHRELFVRYDARLAQTFRRSPDLRLAAYAMSDYRRMYAALLAMAGAREHLCYLWQLMGHGIPNDELLLIKPTTVWTQQLSELSNLDTQLVQQIMADCTIGKKEMPHRNMTMYPFIPLDNSGALIAVMPGFAVASNSEENILRACAARNKSFSDVISTCKEDEAREELRSAIKGVRIRGPLKLEKGMPDVDLLIEEEETGHLIIAELKWLQIPMTFAARDERDRELAKGQRQIRFIQSFLKANPDHFLNKGKMERSLTSYKTITYCVLCRDYIANIGGEIPLIPYEPFRDLLAVGETTLPDAYAYAVGSEWLPKLGIDFAFEMTERTCNGVKLGTKLFIPLYPNQLNITQR
jgi:hypothetical protein